MKEEVRKLKTPTDAFRVAMLDRAKQFGGAKKYALQQAYIELLEDDLLNDTFKDISLLQMNDVYSTLLHQTKETMVFPDLELVTKYGTGNEKIHLYKSQTGSHYLVCNIGVLIFRKGEWEKFKECISIYRMERITNKSYRYTNERLDLNDMKRHLFFQLYHNHNANYERADATKINWKSLKGIKFSRAQVAELPQHRPSDMMT